MGDTVSKYNVEHAALTLAKPTEQSNLELALVRAQLMYLEARQTLATFQIWIRHVDFAIVEACAGDPNGSYVSAYLDPDALAECTPAGFCRFVCEQISDWRLVPKASKTAVRFSGSLS
jgi:hypothetical protein